METTSGEAEEQQLQQQQMQMPPVLEEEKKKRVLVALDESDESMYALKWALDNLFIQHHHHQEEKEGEGEDVRGVVTLLHVQQPFQHYVFPAGPVVYATTSVIESVKKAQEQNSAILFTRALQLCQGRPIKAETVVLNGDPKDMICQAAEQTHADIVVVGSRGLSKLKRAFLGSVSDYCAHHIKCPILIVKPQKGAA